MKKIIALGLCVALAGGLTSLLRAQEGAKTAEYVGAESCKKCHLKQHKIWKETGMAKAFDVLKPDAKKEAKQKAELDPSKDYTRDEKCLKCHTTGYGEAGGYPAIGETWTDDHKKLAGALQGVQCESCHGPGALHAKARLKSAGEAEEGGFGGEGEKTQKKLPKGEIEIPTLETCVKCHNKDSPMFRSMCVTRVFTELMHFDPRKKRTDAEIAARKKQWEADLAAAGIGCGGPEKCEECKKAAQ